MQFLPEVQVTKKLFAQIHINETGVFAVGCLRRRAKLQGCDFLLLFWFNLAPDFLRDGSLSERDPRPPIKWNYNFPFLFYMYTEAARLWKQMENNMWVALAALCHVTMRQRPRLNRTLLKCVSLGKCDMYTRFLSCKLDL